MIMVESAYGQADSIGSIVESTGIGSIVRNDQPLNATINSSINLYDEAQTGNGRILIEFMDNETLSLTEQSKVYIDEVYYDADPDLSRMTMRFARGTARFASGTGARINKANINLSTPTAQIAIRGTDFTTTVDELGRSLIVLLPDEDGNASGEIDVINEGGSITLNEAYQATMISSINTAPSSPVTIQNLTVALIDNMFIVNPPREVIDRINEDLQDDANEDAGLLDFDFLAFNELEMNALDDTGNDLEYSELDIDALDVDFLTDLLDIIEALDSTMVQDESSSNDNFTLQLRGASVGLNADSQYNIFPRDNQVVFYRSVNGVINIVLSSQANATIQTRVEGYEGTIDMNEGNNILINIVQ
tara:strand:- start:1212 stop:2297 length:1086 start_codon:yes stop_codon:yes gene_type:complete